MDNTEWLMELLTPVLVSELQQRAPNSFYLLATQLFLQTVNTIIFPFVEVSFIIFIGVA